MPDRDIFSYQVPRGWKTIARLLIKSEVVPEIAIYRASKKSVSDFRKSGSTAIHEMITLLKALHLHDEDDVRANDISVISQLRRIAATDSSTWGELAARRLGSAAILSRYEPGREPIDLRNVIGQIFVDYVEQQVGFEGLMAAMVADGKASQESVNRRIAEVRTLLAGCYVLPCAASQILEGVEPRRIKLPPSTVPTRSTAEMVNAAL